MENNILYLTTEDLAKLKPLGKGTDGTVYIYKDNYLIKIYHNNYHCIINSDNDNDMKIYRKGHQFSNNFDQNYFKYYANNTDEDIKLLPKVGIVKAIERQKEIELTTLPIGIVYLNNIFAGCLLIRHKGIQIHKLIGLPLSIKRKIYLNILKENAELIKNNVYHIDLSNSPFTNRHTILPDKQIITKGHSHILVNPFNLETNFIDLDGKSTVYTETFNNHFATMNLQNLNILTLEFLFKAEYDEHKENPEELCAEIYEYGLSSSLTEKIAFLNADLEDLKEISRVLIRK